MKKVLLLACLISFYFSAQAASTTAATYALATLSGTYTSLTGGTVVDPFIFSPFLRDTDNAAQRSVPIGFSFVFCGTTYTQLAFGTNGYLSLANCGLTIASNCAGGFAFGGNNSANNRTNLSGIGGGVGMLMPLWDDLNGNRAVTNSSACSGAIARYQTTGTAGSRVFTIEWFNYGLFRATGSSTPSGCGSFQVRLYEGSNAIEFWYGSSSFSGMTATIGIANSGTDFKVLNSNLPFPRHSTSVFDTSISSAPGNGIIYRFCPEDITTDAVNNGPFCSENDVTLLGNSTGTGASYSWTGPSTFTAAVQNPTILSATAAASGVYTFTATIGNCASNDTTLLTVNQTPPRITGIDSVCIGSSVTLSNSLGGGSWSIADASIASISVGGNVTGITSGTTSVTYSRLGCDTSISFRVITPPTVAPIVGGGVTTCAGSTIALTNPTGGGFWSTTDLGIATVDATGNVTGLSGGTATITYSLPYFCGTVDVTTAITFETFLFPGVISGITPICNGTSTSLSASVAGGVWSVADAAIATVDVTGNVTGLTAGSTDVLYAVTNTCGTNDTFFNITVEQLFVLGSITGAPQTCISATTTLANSVGGGSWSSSSPTVATSNSSTGTVTGVSAGSAVITYSRTNSCGTVDSTFNLTVLSRPDSGTVSGSPLICLGSSLTYSETVTGGVWSVSNPSIATIDATGVLTGLALGNVIVSYSVTNLCGTASDTTLVTVTNTLFAGVIVGTPILCVGSTVSLTNATTGGTWSITNPSIATINSSGGLTGLAPGNDTVVYTLSTVCGVATTRFPVTVFTTPTAGTISGATAICNTTSTTLTSSVSGGTWSSANPSIASVSLTGTVSSRSAGSTTISYTVSNICGTSFATSPLSVETYPNAGIISGPTTVCVGSAGIYTDTVVGGTWVSSNPAVATINSLGILVGLDTGNVNIYYVVTNSCGSTNVTIAVAIINAPTVAGISGFSSVCAGTSTLLTNATAGGSWTSSNVAVATVSTSGVVTGLVAGTTTISYGVTNSCGTTYATRTLTVNPAPDPGSISAATSACIRASVVASSSVSGGVWGSSNSSVATISTTGTIIGVSAGQTIISYTVANSCGALSDTLLFTVAPPTDAGTIAGSSTVCTGATTTLTNSLTGGTWYVTDASIGSVVATGAGSASFLGITLGTTTVGYIYTDACGTDTTFKNLTVVDFPSAGVISGTTSVCAGSASVLTGSVSGGVWSTTDSSIAVVSSISSASGNAVGVRAGSTTLSYSVTNACGTASTTTSFTVVPIPPGTITASSTLICVGSTSTLTDTVSGGTWSSSNASIATVSSTGVVTGVSTGTATISYTVTNSCGTGTATVSVNIVSAPTLSAITGPTSLCAGSTVSLSNSTSGGRWSVSSPSIATIDTVSGALTGVAAGITGVTYTVTTGFGCSSAVSRIDTVSPAPAAGTLSASTTSLCAGTTLSLTSSVSGGTWSSGDTALATIDATGLVTGRAAGAVAISYTVTNGCGTAVASTTLNVLAAPTLSAIGGSSSICEGTSLTMTNSFFGGTWSSSNPAVATINPTTGALLALSAGLTTITYTATNILGCTTTVTLADTVRPAPFAGSITAASGTTVCAGLTLSLSVSGTGGTWSSTNTSVAIVDATGTVFGIAGGTADISYTVTNSCGTVAATAGITVNPTPLLGTIVGTTPMCAGTSALFTSTSFGGTWVSANPSVATVNSSTGNVTAVAAGSTVISYTITSALGCSATDSMAVTVYPSADAGTISAATTNVCAGATLRLTTTGVGGVWSSSNTAVATVDTTGNVTAIASGTTTISYTVDNSFGCAVSATVGLNIDPSPVVAPLSGPTSMCTGTGITLTSTTTGGTWSSSNPTVASVNVIGNVSGGSAGTATISYSLTNAFGCTTTVTLADTVSDAPVLGAIGGPSSICTGSPATLTNTTTGGTWASGNTTVATIDNTSGVATGLSAGSTVISYTVAASAGCATTTLTTVSVSVSPTVSATSGTTSACVGAGTTLTNTTPSGVWSSSNPAIATISTTGAVTAVSGGAAQIYYTVTNAASCSTADSVTYMAYGLPAITSIAGGPNACLGATTALTAVGLDTSATGVWSTADASIASIDATTGVVTGVAIGGTTITFTATNRLGCSTQLTTAITVNALPTVSATSGPATVCAGATVTLSNATTGGVWSSADSSIATVTTTGAVTGRAAGATTIAYTVTSATTGCSATATHALTVNPAPSVTAISGPAGICIGSVTTYTNATTGGVWANSNNTVATVNVSGAVNAIAAGSTTLSYTVTGTAGCTATATLAITVSTPPTVSAITGPTTVCAGSSITLADTTTGGVWSSSDTTMVTVSATGVVAARAAGTPTISYTVTNASGCSASATVSITINAAPATPTISGATTICIGSSVSLTGSAAGGTWVSSDSAVATISSAGVATAVGAGSSTVSYTVTNAAGCSATGIATLTTGVAPTGTIANPPSVTLCSGPVTLSVTATGASSYQWYRGGVAVAGATNSSYTTDTAGAYTVQISNGGCSVTISGVNVQQAPAPIINRGAGTTLYTGSFASYQWYINGVAISGATGATYNATTGGSYTVEVTDANGCSRLSAAYVLTSGGGSAVNTVAAVDIKWYPNPTTSVLHIAAPMSVNIAVISPDGKLLLQENNATEVNVSNLAPGIYLLRIYDQNNQIITTERFMKAE
jgi:uncharacterized protein YjdB